MNYRDLYHQSITDGETFWAEAAADIHWFRTWDRVLDDSNPPSTAGSRGPG